MIDDNNIQIKVKNLTKIYNKPRHLFAGGLFAYKKPTFALDDISFSVTKGESIGIIGENGSGKSTLLKILSNVTNQTSGEKQINAKIYSLLELGCGFNPEYTGISNIYLNGTIYGLTKKEITDLIPFIKSFADIGNQINDPVKTYSSGMFLRLAFACAISLKPDILIIDEALAVGDFAFRQKCYNKISKMSENKTTLILVSHDIDVIRRFCKRTIWLKDGKIKKDGDTKSVSALYMQYITGNSKNILQPNNYTVTESNISDNSKNCNTKKSAKFSDRFGSAVGCIKSIDISKIQITGNSYQIKIITDIPRVNNYNSVALSVSIKNEYGLDLIVFSSMDNNITFSKSGTFEIFFNYTCDLCQGCYSVSVSLEDRSTQPITYYDYINNASDLKVISNKEYFGVFHPTCHICAKENKNVNQ